MSGVLMISNLLLAPSAQEREISGYTTIVAVALLALSFVYLLVLHVGYWDRGVFPPFIRFSRSNYHHAVIELAKNIIKHDRDAFEQKQEMITAYLRQWFPEQKHSRKDITSFSDPVSTKSTGSWLHKKKISPKEKLDLLEFLFQLAVADGVIGQREYAELQILTAELKLSSAVLEELVRTFRQSNAEKVFEEQERSRKARTEMRQTESLSTKQRALNVLGLPQDAQLTDIKKQYRKLVMTCHPDMIQSGSEVDIAAAKTRFLEIQQAYEYLIEVVLV